MIKGTAHLSNEIIIYESVAKMAFHQCDIAGQQVAKELLTILKLHSSYDSASKSNHEIGCSLNAT